MSTKDDDASSFQLPEMPSPVSARPRFVTNHLVGTSFGADSTMVNPSGLNASLDVSAILNESTTTAAQTPSARKALVGANRLSGRRAFTPSKTARGYAHQTATTPSLVKSPFGSARSARSRKPLQSMGSARGSVPSPFGARHSRIDSSTATLNATAINSSFVPGNRTADTTVASLATGTTSRLNETLTAAQSPFAKSAQLSRAEGLSQLGAHALDDLTSTSRINHTLQFPADEKRTLEEHFLSLFAEAGDFANLDQAFAPCQEYASVLKENLTSLADDMTLGTRAKFEAAVGAIQRAKDARATWLLLAAVVPTHFIRTPERSMDDVLSACEEDIVNNYLFTNDAAMLLEERVAVWLETVASEALEDYIGEVLYETDDVAWRQTLNFLLSSESSAREPLANFPKSVDPDALTRYGGILAPQDAEEEKIFLKRIFTLIRCGKYDMAIKLCQACNQPWRAATLAAFRFSQREKSDYVVDTKMDTNRNAQLKAICRAMVDDERIDVYERAIYGALAGIRGPILEISSSWHDVLWAHVKTKHAANIAQELKRLSMSGDGSGTPNSLEGNSDADVEEEEDALDLEDVFGLLEEHVNEDVRQESLAIFSKLQKHLILGDPMSVIDAMWGFSAPFLDECRGVVAEEGLVLPLDESTPRFVNKTKMAEEIQPYLCQFAHFVLLFRGVAAACERSSNTVFGSTEDLSAALAGKGNDILEAYVYDLIDKHAHVCIAKYTAQLADEDAKTRVFSFYLAGMADEDLKHDCLIQARAEDLPLTMITQAVVKRVRTSTEHQFHTNGAPQPSSLPTQTGAVSEATEISATERQMIETLELLIQNPEQKFAALVETNAVLRQFISEKKFAAAGELFYKRVLPADLTKVDPDMLLQSTTVQNACKEQLSLRAYLDAVLAYKKWWKHTHEAKPEHPEHPKGSGSIFRPSVSQQELNVYRTKMDIWQHRYREYTELAIGKLMNILSMPWMHDDAPAGEEADEFASSHGHRRTLQMKLLRRYTLPDVALDLIEVMHEDKRYQECLELANLVACNEHGLLDILRDEKDKLRRLLSCLRASSLELLRTGTGDAFGTGLEQA